MSNIVNNPDYEPVILKKKTLKQSQSFKPKIKEVDIEENPIKYTPREIGLEIMKKRTEMKMKQTELAKKLNVPVKEIQDIENGKAIENKKLISRIKKMLKIIS